MQIQTPTGTQTMRVLFDLGVTINFVLQIFLIKYSYIDIGSLSRIRFVNNEIAYRYRIVNFDYFITNSEEILESGNMPFYSVDIISYKMILSMP